jgi:hypothetical protein
LSFSAATSSSDSPAQILGRFLVRECHAEKLEKLDSIFFVVYLISSAGVR